MDRHSLDPLGTVRSGLSRVELAIRRFGTEIISRYPRFQSPVLRLWSQYMSAYGAFQAKHTAFLGGHRAPIDPFTIISLDPARIEYVVEDDGYPNQIRRESAFPPPKFKHAGRVVSGDWDARNTRFDETDVYRGFDARFTRGVPWHETEFYRQSVAYIEDGIELWGCTSEAEFQRRCEFVESLYHSIATDGYRSQSELATATVDPLGGDPQAIETVTDEITVCIGRDGEFLFMDGRNRLSIAKILDLDRVPVWIMARHAGWQRTRDQVAGDRSRQRALPERLRDHPDLAGLQSDRRGSGRD